MTSIGGMNANSATAIIMRRDECLSEPMAQLTITPTPTTAGFMVFIVRTCTKLMSLVPFAVTTDTVSD